MVLIQKEIKKVCIRPNWTEVQIRPPLPHIVTWSFDFSDGTRDATKIANTFASTSGNTNFITGSWYTSNTSTSTISWKITDDWNNYHKITIKMNWYIPTWRYAQYFWIASNISDLSNSSIYARMQDYNSGSYRGKRFTRLGTQLATTQAFYGWAWYDKIMTYDWSTWDYSFTINWNTIFSWNDWWYSSVASAYQWTLYVYCWIETWWTGNTCFWKTVERTLE